MFQLNLANLENLRANATKVTRNVPLEVLCVFETQEGRG